MTWQGRDSGVTVPAVPSEKPQLRPLAEYLRGLRETSGLSQAQAAALSGVQTRQWQRWEAAESEPYLSNLRRLADGFDVPVEDVVMMRPRRSTPRPPAEIAQLDRIEAQLAKVVSLLEVDAAEQRAAFQRALEEAYRQARRQADTPAEASDGPRR